MPDATSVLFVDDNRNFLIAATDALDMFGYSVEPVSDPQAALSRVEQGIDFDILLVDLNLGDTVSGADVVKAARKAAPDLPVIYLTGGLTGTQSESGLDGELVMKTDGPMVLRDALKRALGAAPSV